MTTRAFVKGQPVTYFGSYDDKGTIRVIDLVVYSCGAKQMVLAHPNGDKFAGANFLPQVVQSLEPTPSHHTPEVWPRMTAEAAEAHALEMGARFVEGQREHFRNCRERYATAGPGYLKSIAIDEAALHEPRVVRL